MQRETKVYQWAISPLPEPKLQARSSSRAATKCSNCSRTSIHRSRSRRVLEPVTMSRDTFGKIPDKNLETGREASMGQSPMYRHCKAACTARFPDMGAAGGTTVALKDSRSERSWVQSFARWCNAASVKRGLAATRPEDKMRDSIRGHAHARSASVSSSNSN